MNMLRSPFLLVLLFSVLVQGCASLQQSFDTPGVELVSVKPLNSNNLEQRFEVALRIINPNPVTLNLAGISYDVELGGYKLVSGVAANIEPITAYADGLVTIEASLSLLQSMRFVASMLKQPKSTVAYKLSAKLDTGLPLIGKVAVADAGEIALSGQ